MTPVGTQRFHLCCSMTFSLTPASLCPVLQVRLELVSSGSYLPAGSTHCSARWRQQPSRCVTLSASAPGRGLPAAVPPAAPCWAAPPAAAPHAAGCARHAPAAHSGGVRLCQEHQPLHLQSLQAGKSSWHSLSNAVPPCESSRRH